MFCFGSLKLYGTFDSTALKSDMHEATSEELVRSSPPITTLVAHEHLAIDHRRIVAPRRQSLNALQFCVQFRSEGRREKLFIILYIVLYMNSAWGRIEGYKMLVECALSTVSTEANTHPRELKMFLVFLLPDSIGIPSKCAEILRVSDQQFGWSRYSVSSGTRPGSMKSTCAGSELEPWKANGFFFC